MKKFNDFFQIGEAREFLRKKYPWVNLDNLNWIKIRDMANGDLIPVRKSGKFILMTPEEISPGGKLDRMNEDTRNRNRKIRDENRIREMEFFNSPEGKKMGDLILQLRKINRGLK